MHEELDALIEALSFERDMRNRYGLDTSIQDGLIVRAQLLRHLPEDLVSALSSAARSFADSLA